jgi:pyruvate/2-oxoglutarate dehydrogenase complex dihydrolipoamide acyltransferase (E2) component
MDITIPVGHWRDEDSAVISSWLYNDGDVVQTGAVVAEIMVEKASFEIVAPGSGTLRIGVGEEIEVQQGDVVGHIA